MREFSHKQTSVHLNQSDLIYEMQFDLLACCKFKE